MKKKNKMIPIGTVIKNLCRYSNVHFIIFLKHQMHANVYLHTYHNITTLYMKLTTFYDICVFVLRFDHSRFAHFIFCTQYLVKKILSFKR